MIILASTSRYRRELFARLGLPFESHAPPVDEDEWKERGLTPKALAEELAVAKAVSLAAQFPEAILIGSDQVCACDGTILHKPQTVERAREQLQFIAGREHQQFTAVAVWQAGQVRKHTDVTTLRVRPLSSAEIERYIAVDSPLDCAGSYRLEKAGIALFDAIVSDDHTAIIGLPLMGLSRLLRECGVQMP